MTRADDESSPFPEPATEIIEKGLDPPWIKKRELKADVRALQAEVAALRKERDEAENRIEAEVSRAASLAGDGWAPTTSIDATLAEMEKRGLDAWVRCINAWLGSAGAYYTAEAYRNALGRAKAAEVELARVVVEHDRYRDALELIAKGQPSAGATFIAKNALVVASAAETDSRLAE